MRVVRTVLYSIDIGNVSVFTVQTDDTSDETEVSPTASIWLICVLLLSVSGLSKGVVKT